MPVATPTNVREGFRTVTPYITVPEGAEVIEFLKQTFHAEETFRASAPEGGFHAEVRIEDSMLMIGGGEMLRGRSRPNAFHLYLADCDAAYERALEAGAKSLGEPGDRPYGERSAYVEDVAGNHWYIATRFAGTEAPAGMGTVTPFLHARSAPELVGFLERAFGAVELDRHVEGGRVMHTAVRIGDAILEMGEVEDQERPIHFPATYYLNVDDADAWYRRAIAAGAKSLQEPADQPYGVRMGGVEDPLGNQWFPATPLRAGA